MKASPRAGFEALGMFARGPKQEAPDGIHLVLVSQIFPAENQPRREFPQESLEELAASIKAYGIIEPLVARSIGTEVEPRFELIAGERRLRASRIAGLDRVPVIVRNVDRVTARRLRMIENLHREDLSPLDEAWGFQDLMEIGMTAEELGALIQKKKCYVYNSLKLCRLPEMAVQALKSGQISKRVGEIIGRIEDEADREKAAKVMCTPGYENECFTYRMALNWMRNNGGKNLYEARFDLASDSLDPQAGPCETCPKRLGQAEAAVNDICGDVHCFERKRLAFLELQRQDFVSRGIQVIETDKVFENWGGKKWNSGFVGLSDPVSRSLLRADKQDAGNGKTWSNLLGTAVATHVAFAPDGEAFPLVPVSAAIALATKGGHDIFSRTPGTTYEQEEKERREENREQRIERELKDWIWDTKSERFAANLDRAIAELPVTMAMTSLALAIIGYEERDGELRIENPKLMPVTAGIARTLGLDADDHPEEEALNAALNDLPPKDAQQLALAVYLTNWFAGCVNPRYQNVSEAEEKRAARVFEGLGIEPIGPSGEEIDEKRAKIEAGEGDDEGGDGDQGDDDDESRFLRRVGGCGARVHHNDEGSEGDDAKV